MHTFSLKAWTQSVSEPVSLDFETNLPAYAGQRDLNASPLSDAMNLTNVDRTGTGGCTGTNRGIDHFVILRVVLDRTLFH